MKTKKPRQQRGPRRMTVGFEKHANKPSAFADGKFVAPPGSVVYVWRTRSGCKPSWYKCQVVRAVDDFVELWDELFAQFFVFNPQEKTLPDVRLNA